MDHSDQNKRIAKNSIFLSIRMVIVLGINLYTTRAVLNMLGVVDYGIYSIVGGFVALFTFLNSAMTNGIQRFYNYELGRMGNEGLKRVYNASCRIQALVAIIILIITEIVGVWYLENKMVLPLDRKDAAFVVMQYSIWSFVIVIFQVPFNSVIIAKEQFGFFSIVSVLNAVLMLLATLLLSFVSSDKLEMYGLFILIINFIVLLLYAAYALTRFKELKIERYYDKHLFSQMLKFSGWNLLGTLAGVGRDQGVDVILNLFYGPIVNAARGVANQVNGGLQSLVSNLSVSVRPQVVKSFAQGELERTINLTYGISKLSCILLYMISLPIILEINTILRIWLGENIPDHTSSFIFIIILTSFLHNLNSSISGVVHSSGKMKLYQITGSSISLLSLPAIYYILRSGGSPESALWVLFVAMIISQIAALLVLKTIITFSILKYLNNVILPFLMTVVMSFLVPFYFHEILNEGIARLVVVTILSIFTCSFIAFYFALNKSEQHLCMTFIRNIISKVKTK